MTKCIAFPTFVRALSIFCVLFRFLCALLPKFYFFIIIFVVLFVRCFSGKTNERLKILFLGIFSRRKQDGDMLWMRITFFAFYFELWLLESSAISWTYFLKLFFW